MKRYLVVILICAAFLSACTVNLVVPTPAPTPTPSAPVMPHKMMPGQPTTDQMVSVLASLGFGYSVSQDCAPKPCTQYAESDLKMVAMVFPGGAFSVGSFFGAGADAEKQAHALSTIVVALYGLDVFDWIAANINKVKEDGENQTGIVNNIKITMSLITTNEGYKVFVIIFVPLVTPASGSTG